MQWHFEKQYKKMPETSVTNVINKKTSAPLFRFKHKNELNVTLPSSRSLQFHPDEVALKWVQEYHKNILPVPQKRT
jgi:hypothetical protein